MDTGRLDDLGTALALARQLAGRARALALQLGLPEFGEIGNLGEIGRLDLPAVSRSAADIAGLQAAAALYFASELEQTGLVPAAEMFAGVYATGAFDRDVGAAGPMLLGVWRQRHQRFDRTERQAIFARLFGTSGPVLATPGGPGANTEFEARLIDLAEAIYRLDQPAIPAGAIRHAGGVAIAGAAERLIDNLAPRTRGISTYAAAEIVTLIRQAVAIFSQRPVQAALGTATMWEAVGSATQRFLGERVDPDPHLRRGRDGQILLAWLSANATALAGGVISDTEVSNEVVAAAATWLQVSLSLAEREPAVAGR